MWEAREESEGRGHLRRAGDQEGCLVKKEPPQPHPSSGAGQRVEGRGMTSRLSPQGWEQGDNRVSVDGRVGLGGLRELLPGLGGGAVMWRGENRGEYCGSVCGAGPQAGD